MKNAFVILIILLIFTGFVMANLQLGPQYHISRGEELVNSTLTKTAKIIKKKWGLKPCGEGGAMPGGPLQKLMLCFETKKSFSKSELRCLIIKSSHELLNQVNENHEMQEYLKEPPFTIKNVQIIIYNHDKNGRILSDPDIANAQILQGVLEFATKESEESFGYKNQFRESYEEALKILEQSNDEFCSDAQSIPDIREKQNPRISELIPNLLCRPLAVNPGIPDNFIALSPKGTLHPYDWIYWGPKDVLEAYFKNPPSLNGPILRVKLSANVAQIGPNSFSADLESLKNEDFAFTEMMWGEYPVLAIRTMKEGKLIFMAWVGLNDPEGRWTLMFNLVYPEREGHPNKEDRELWESLLAKTKPLKV